MKKKVWMILVVLSLETALFSFSSCSINVDRALNGEWVRTGSWSGESRVIYESGHYEFIFDGFPDEKGTYTTSSGVITYTPTHVYGIFYGLDDRYYTKNEFLKAVTDEEETFDFNKSSRKYTINDNMCTFVNSRGDEIVYIKTSGSGKKSESSAKSSGSASALAGRWSLAEGPRRSNPEEMELLKDGTGICDGVGITWKIENGRFYLIHPLAAFSSIYNVSGSSLTLTKDDGEVLKYKKK